MIDVDSMELTLNLHVCLSSKHGLWGLCAVNGWMMICQGVRTRFLVYDDEWATLPPRAMFSISRLSLWLPAAQTLPLLTALPARLTVIQSPAVARDHLSAHTSTSARRSQNRSRCCAQQEAGALHSSEGLYGIQMDGKWKRGAEGEQDPSLSQFEWQAEVAQSKKSKSMF